jgi:hypothetical protein
MVGLKGTQGKIRAWHSCVTIEFALIFSPCIYSSTNIYTTQIADTGYILHETNFAFICNMPSEIAHASPTYSVACRLTPQDKFGACHPCVSFTLRASLYFARVIQRYNF